MFLSPCNAERAGAQREQPADARDDRPQRAHRLHHRQGGIQSGRDQVKFTFLWHSTRPPFWLKVHFVPTNFVAAQTPIFLHLTRLHCLATSIQAFKLRSHFWHLPLGVMICLSNFCICISSQEFPYFKHALTHFDKFYTESSVKGSSISASNSYNEMNWSLHGEALPPHFLCRKKMLMFLFRSWSGQKLGPNNHKIFNQFFGISMLRIYWSYSWPMMRSKIGEKKWLL